MLDFTVVKRQTDKNTDFFYYTPVTNKINFQVFKDYKEKLKEEQICEKVADLMGEIENLIVSSNAFKSQENKPIVNQCKWQAYKVKKIPLTNLFMILNKMSVDNLDKMIEESITYKSFTQEEVNQLADVFLGKCIMETKNVKLFIEYFKAMMNNKLWYVKHTDKVISFRDTMLDRLENEYDRLTRIAGHIEDVFKNRIRDDNSQNELDGSEDYLKKKNIILSLINLIGTFFNNHLISFSLLDHIFGQLKNQYNGCTSKKIYLELWLVLWDNVSNNLNDHFNDKYTEYINWLTEQKNKLIELVTTNNDSKNNIADISRLVSLIDSSLNKNSDNVTSKVDESSFYNLKDNIKFLKSSNDYIKFKKMYDDDVIRNFIIKHLFENTVAEGSILNTSIKMIKEHLMDSETFNQLVTELLEDDDVICDYPNYRKYISKYVSL